MRSEERATSVQAGRYLMKTQMKAIDALRLLINPGSSKIRLQFTIPEGLRLSAQVDQLAKRTKIKKVLVPGSLGEAKTAQTAQVREEPTGRFPVSRDLRADSGFDGNVDFEADGGPVQIGNAARSSSRQLRRD